MRGDIQNISSGNIVAFPTTAKPRKAKRAGAIKLTKTAIAKLALPKGKIDFCWWDTELAGFGIRMRAGGRLSWIVQFRTGKVLKRMTLGTTEKLDPEEARAEARKLLGKATLGHDPAEAKQESRKALRFGDLIEAYLAFARDKQRASTFADTERNVRVHGKPLHKLTVGKIARRDIAALHEKLTETAGPVQANRVLASLSAMFSWLISRDYVQANVALGVSKNREVAKDRTLTDDELRTIWTATTGQDDFSRIVRLLLLTGARRQEVGSMRWQDIATEGDATIWTIPKAHSKNGRENRLPLVLTALGCLPERGTGAAFGRPPKKGEGRGYSGWSKAMARLQKDVSFDDWSLHDLRRTVATRMSDLSVMPAVVEAILNHVSGTAKGGVLGIYNKASYDQPKREALEAWADELARIVE